MDGVGKWIEKRALDIRFARKAFGKRRFKDYVRERNRCDVITSMGCRCTCKVQAIRLLTKSHIETIFRCPRKHLPKLMICIR